MEEYPITARSLEKHYHIDGDQFERQYKEHLSGYKDWGQKGHAEEWMVFEDNIGEQLSIDETALSNGELYTIIENKAAHGGKGTIVAMVKGTKAENVISALEHIDEQKRGMVREVTMDLSDSMRKIVRLSFPNATRVIDRFHVQKLALEAVQEIRIKNRWAAIDADNAARADAKAKGEEYNPHTYDNGVPGENCWQGAGICSISLPGSGRNPRKHEPDCCSQNTRISRQRMAWHSGFGPSSTSAPPRMRYDEVLNYFNQLSTNANAESFNAKVKAFRSSLRGVSDINFFFFRLQKIYA